MPLSPTRFATLRPYLYHLTATANVPHIERTRRLEPASVLLARAGRTDLVRIRRREHEVVVMADGQTVHVRDQAPLHRGNVHLDDGWEFGELVADLNRRVYFWPGDDRGPSDYGRRHFARYASEPCAVLVVPTAALLRPSSAAPSSPAAEFSACNSGAPRCNPRSTAPGRKAPRGPRTFLPAREFDGTPSDVVEVTFPGGVDLPWEAVRVMDPAEVLGTPAR